MFWRSTILALAASTCSHLGRVQAAPYSQELNKAPLIQGGVGNAAPIYRPLSAFDYQSFVLVLNQEYLELALFQQALDKFTTEEWQAAGFTPEDQYLIQFMHDQEIGHVDLVTNILGGPENAPQACNYTFPFETVQEFVDLSMKVTRVGESGVFGFLNHLDSRAAATVLGEAIAVESRQQMLFRQFEGLFPMPFSFIPVITQAMAWTQQTIFTTSCPASNPHVEWQAFPYLNVTNAPNATVLPDGNTTAPAISTNRTALSSPGATINLSWDSPGQQVGPDNNYTTATGAGEPKFVAWISQLNTTYTPLTNVTNNTGVTTQPGGTVFGGDINPTVNGTIFVLITDEDVPVTPFNISAINPHVVAGPALYVAG